jgi:hypothetical protein
MKRLAFILGVGFAVAQPLQADPAAPLKPGLTDTANSPHVVVRSVGLTEVRWTSGFWAERFDTCRKTSVPAMGRRKPAPPTCTGWPIGWRNAA